MSLFKEKRFLRVKGSPRQLSWVVYFLPLAAFAFLLKEYIRTRYGYWVPSLFQYFLITLIAFVLVLFLIPLCMKLAQHFGIVDKSNDFKKAVGPIPLLGGLGVFLAFLITIFFFKPWSPQIQAIVTASSIIVLIGTLDDIRPLSSGVRLVGQILASSIVMVAGMKVSFMPHTWWGEGLAVFITLFWILGIVNATNFVDGVDGLAAGFTVIAGSFFFLITLHLGQHGPALVAAILAGCGAGFLVFNFKPAKIYLGDGGSTLMGFLLACLALYGGWSNWGPVIALGIPVMILGVLIFDMIYITISRIKNGHVRNFKQWLDYRGHDHFHHRLIHLGFKEEEAVIFIYSTSIILGLSALVIENAHVSYPVVVLLIQATMIFINITILMLIGRQIEADAPSKK